MKSEKHLQKKQQMINTAFLVWNKNSYFSTSLNDIAEHLHITKQAIYRYFKGKKDLLHAMEDQIVRDYSSNSQLILKKIEALSGRESVEVYVMNQISFFKNHKDYLNFLISIIRLKDNDQKEFREILLKQNNYLQEKLALPAVAINYIFNLILFYQLLDNEAGVETMTKEICHLFYNGFATDLLTAPDNIDEILLENRISPRNKDDNKILRAISDAVLEEGPEGASMGKIAAKAGMSKSSLYFYFKNKEEMIINTMNNKTERFVEFYYDRVSRYSLVGQQLFAHFVITASMIIEQPKTMPLVHWFIARGMAENLKKPTSFEKYRIFFENAANYHYIETHGVTADQLLMLVNFCVTYEISNIHKTELNKEEKYKLIYGLYELFTQGLKGLKGR